MAQYPIKLLKDESGVSFAPLTSSGSTIDYQYADHVDTSYQEVRWTYKEGE